ncbi:MAG: pyridoxal-phosphate dependent enzyme [Bacteroidota bacterium]|nr:pyridoxal-phosphate dependent enzyme [Bacteroidota bacterium]
MIELPEIKNIHAAIDSIKNDLTTEKNLALSILRLDKIHPQTSGNKFFKLYYFLQTAISSHKKIITFGGAYSNHLAAAASACKRFGIKCIAIVRAEEPKILSHTLLFCKQQGMHLQFISREIYKRKDEEDFKKYLTEKYGEHILIPEGGYSTEGTDGAALIAQFYKKENFTHICCSVGTATTLAGLIKSSEKTQQIIGFSAIKNLTDHESRLHFLLSPSLAKNYCIINDYHFGGFAKWNEELISFMNKFYTNFGIPTDFIYTSKMMFGVFDLLKKNYFHPNSKILCIHTGGLQGNLSFPINTLLNF